MWFLEGGEESEVQLASCDRLTSPCIEVRTVGSGARRVSHSGPSVEVFSGSGEGEVSLAAKYHRQP